MSQKNRLTDLFRGFLSIFRDVLPGTSQNSALDPRFGEALDIRGNRVGATQDESSWAVRTLRGQTPDHLAGLVEHFAKVADVISSSQPKLAADVRRELSRVDHSTTGIAFAQSLIRTGGPYKKALDAADHVLKHRNPGLNAVGRSIPEFVKRGRIAYSPAEAIALGRLDSIENLHGGISAHEHRRPSMDNIFTEKVRHAQGHIRRATPGSPDYGTSRAFAAAGAPFIAGASGTLQAHIQLLEIEKPLGHLNSAERRAREVLIGNLTAGLVAGGHHSMSECLIVVRAYGYFGDIPHPLEDYREAMRALRSRLGKLGVGPGDAVADRAHRADALAPPARTAESKPWMDRVGRDDAISREHWTQTAAKATRDAPAPPRTGPSARV